MSTRSFSSSPPASNFATSIPDMPRTRCSPGVVAQRRATARTNTLPHYIPHHSRAKKLSPITSPLCQPHVQVSQCLYSLSPSSPPFSHPITAEAALPHPPPPFSLYTAPLAPYAPHSSLIQSCPVTLLPPSFLQSYLSRPLARQDVVRQRTNPQPLSYLITIFHLPLQIFILYRGGAPLPILPRVVRSRATMKFSCCEG